VGKRFQLLLTAPFLHTRKYMPSKEKNVHKKSRGRPAGSRYAGNIPCRLPPKTLTAVDELAAREDVTRSEAIRRLIELALAVKAKKQNSDK
jgi:Ribbon-helix-helix protein, copG family